jgi:hypothetical protein
VSIATVYLGMNVVPAFFLILGWAEGYKHGKGYKAISSTNVIEDQVQMPFKFNRVIH